MKHLLLIAFLAVASMANAQTSEVFNDDATDVSLSIGYVNKQWSSKINGSNYRENLWGEEGKRLHGVQFGGAYKPQFTSGVGLGLYAGLFFEVYFSESKEMGYDEFTECDLYVPIHLNLDIPLGNQVKFNVHGGLGLDYAIHGGFTNRDAWYWDWDVTGGMYKHYYELDHISYGENGWPKRFNASAEIAAAFKFSNFFIQGQYSFGLTNHNFYPNVTDCSTHQNKLAISLGIEF